MGHGVPQPGGGGDAIVAAFESARDRLLGTAYFVLGSREDARDAVQEAFVRAWRRRDEIGAIQSVPAWVATVVLNTAKDLRRRRTIRRTDALPPEDVVPDQVRHSDPAIDAERRDAVARVRSVLHALSEPEREVFLLRQNGDLPFAAIAEALGIPIGTAKTRMRAALKRLREALDPARAAAVRL